MMTSFQHFLAKLEIYRLIRIIIIEHVEHDSHTLNTATRPASKFSVEKRRQWGGHIGSLVWNEEIPNAALASHKCVVLSNAIDKNLL